MRLVPTFCSTCDPIVVGLGAAWYTAQQGKVSDRENKDNQRETALNATFDCQ